MIEKTFDITWEFGLAERSGYFLAKTASDFKCQIKARKDGQEFDGKTFMGLMLLGADRGSKITLIADGEDGPRPFAAMRSSTRNGE